MGPRIVENRHSGAQVHLENLETLRPGREGGREASYVCCVEVQFRAGRRAGSGTTRLALHGETRMSAHSG